MGTTRDEPSGRAVLVCPACEASLTAPLRTVPDPRLFAPPPAIRRQGIQATQGFWRRAEPGELSQGVPTDPFPVSIHPHDLVVPQVETSGGGCCGVYSEDGSANLHCRCGAPVGVLVDECVFNVEVRLGAFWRVGGDDEVGVGELADDRVRRSLDRWSGVRFAGPPISIDTSWGWTAIEVPTRREVEHLELHLTAGDEGVAVHAVVDGHAIALPLAPLDLLRAIALERLPVGNEGLALRYDLLLSLRENRVISSWGLLRRGKDVELVESPASTTYPTGFDIYELSRMSLAEARAIGVVMGRESEPRGWRFSEAALLRAWSAAIAACEPERLPASG
ncbi:hypothetical protein [Nannocystis radixulma]|uniref:Uncharacterized protein n=1 Tax=Nannocystis radixulma TaxID=2995305 RepID=A0ABT5B929_9BACT|nr:hypothetical protein [Nannocystis radixulma]MDC0670631.1 hypothetical protein [Nannocystis radixulma]